MIYLGLIQFENDTFKGEELRDTLKAFTDTKPAVLKKDSLLLCYGKLSSTHDFDEVWENKSGLIVGRIFDKISHEPFKKNTFDKLSNVDKEKILDKFWGKYASIFTKDKGTCIEVVLDSTGQLPFFYYVLPNNNILFSSHVHLIFNFLREKPDFNWSYLCSYLLYGNSSAIETPFKNIYELPPSCSLKITKNEKSITPLWNLLKTCECRNSQRQNAVEVLTSTLKSWVNPYKNIIVSLSGGLDSSSLLYCLSQIKSDDQNLRSINYFHSQIQSSNEVNHARRVCQETETELIELDVSNSLPFDEPQGKLKLMHNKPHPGLVSLRWTEVIFDQITSKDSCVFVSGHGSDHIFMRPPSKRAPIDYLVENGIGGFKKQIDGLTHFYRAPYFSILKENLKSLSSFALNSQKENWRIRSEKKELPQWIYPKAINNFSPTFTHPFFTNLQQRILPGKFNQIDLFYEGIASIQEELVSQENPTYYPFLYQPIVEFALSFPTYELFKNKYDRYPLREAISNHFKTDTVWRRDKSQTTGILQQGVKKNFKKVCDLCLEGELAKYDFINKDSLLQTISLIANGDVKFLWNFIHLASAEIFLKEWQRGSP